MARTKARKGPIKLPEFEPEPVDPQPRPAPTAIDLPPRQVIEAGVAKFLEMASLYWPTNQGGFKMTSFDLKNSQQLAMALGIVYMAMREKDFYGN
jgi:hypothetical protein